MQWETTEQRRPRIETTLRRGDLRLSCDEEMDDGGRTWQYFHMAFGEFSDDNIEDCQAVWPREAIDRARKLLDELEASLSE